MQKENIKIEGHVGTWYVIDESEWDGEKVFLLEHETYGDETACLIVNEDLKVILKDVWNGFDDLENLRGIEMENTKSLYPSQDKEIRKFELENGFITYATLSRYVGDMILANTYVENTQTFAPYSGTDEKEDGTPKEFFQYFIISEQGAEFLAEYAPDEVVYYDEDYDLYVWCIDHFGTAWSGVLTNVRAKEC